MRQTGLVVPVILALHSVSGCQPARPAVARRLPHPRGQSQPSAGRERGNEDWIVAAIEAAGPLREMFSGLGGAVVGEQLELRTGPRWRRACEAVTKPVWPRTAINSRSGQKQFIVNQPANRTDLRQVVQVTECQSPNSTCSRQGHTRCKQEFMDHKLVALNVELQELVVDSFKFPSSCTCYVERREWLGWLSFH